jgi:hypothetical protein
MTWMTVLLRKPKGIGEVQDGSNKLEPLRRRKEEVIAGVWWP